ncbi:MAG: hypothetical protein AAGG68_15620 [Bacteroidota bacterium]
MRILLSTLFALCLCAGQTFAQVKMPPKTIIFYQDGSVFLGEIIDENSQEISLIISTLDTIRVNKNFIRRIRRTPKDIIMHTNGKYHYTKGMFGGLEYGYGLSANYTVQFDVIAGIHLDSKYAVGIGTGIHSYTSVFQSPDNNNFNWITNNFFPLYAYGRYTPWNKRWRPYFDVKVGYGSPIQSWWDNNDRKGGLLFQPGVGLKFASRNNFRFKISLSQAVQRAVGTSFRWDNLGNEVQFDYRLWQNRTMLKIGIEFR